jgi:small subunit ribosomal protein S17
MASPEVPKDQSAEQRERRRKRAAARQRRRARDRERAAQRPAAPPTTPLVAQSGPGRPRVRQGIVVSAKPDKTVSVRIDTARQHRVYGKTIRESSTLHVHDERNDAQEGDTVRVVETRPLSRLKRWRLVEILERAR